MSRINYADMVFDGSETTQYIYLYDDKFRFTSKQPLEINYSNGEYNIPANSTDVPMDLVLGPGYVAVYNIFDRTWTKVLDVWARTYYYKTTGDIVTNPDPNRLNEYTEHPKPFPTAIYNEEYDQWIYPVDEYREFLKGDISRKLEVEANDDFIMSSDGHKVAVSYLVQSNLKQALLKLTFAVDPDTGEPALTVPFDTYPVEAPTTIGEVVEQDARNEVIQVSADEIDRLMNLLDQKFTYYGEKYKELEVEVEGLSDEEVNRLQMESIANSAGSI